MKNLKKILLDIVYPRRCPVCDGVMGFGEGLIHSSCAGRLLPIRGNYCMKCGKPLFESTGEYCIYCQGARHLFESNLAAFVYNKAMSEAIYRFKYMNRPEYACLFGSQMAKAIRRRRELTRAGLIIPVPLYAQKQRARGFNQAELLAREISGLLGIPMDASLVMRTRATRAQKELDAQERRKNLKKAFKIRQNDVKLESVLIIDDIFTTGSTVDEIAGVLKRAGVKKVYSATLATGAPKT